MSSPSGGTVNTSGSTETPLSVLVNGISSGRCEITSRSSVT